MQIFLERNTMLSGNIVSRGFLDGRRQKTDCFFHRSFNRKPVDKTAHDDGSKQVASAGKAFPHVRCFQIIMALWRDGKIPHKGLLLLSADNACGHNDLACVRSWQESACGLFDIRQITAIRCMVCQCIIIHAGKETQFCQVWRDDACVSGQLLHAV